MGTNHSTPKQYAPSTLFALAISISHLHGKLLAEASSHYTLQLCLQLISQHLLEHNPMCSEQALMSKYAKSTRALRALLGPDQAAALSSLTMGIANPVVSWLHIAKADKQKGDIICMDALLPSAGKAIKWLRSSHRHGLQG